MGKHKEEIEEMNDIFAFMKTLLADSQDPSLDKFQSVMKNNLRESAALMNFLHNALRNVLRNIPERLVPDFIPTSEQCVKILGGFGHYKKMSTA